MKKITLECFTSNAGIHELFPISSTKKYIPEWFKDIPPILKKTNEVRIEHDIPTLKRCDGLTKLYKNGWVLPIWADFIIETAKDGEYRWTCSADIKDGFGGSTIVNFSKELVVNMFDDYVHIKIVVPWYIREKTGVDFYFSGNTWGIIPYWDDIIIMPGILNFKDQHSAHINMFVKKERSIMLEHNTPLIYCVPLAEVKLEVKNYLATDQEYKHLKQSEYGFSLTGNYKNRVKLKKHFLTLVSGMR